MLLLIRSLHYHKLSHPSGFGSGYKSNLVHSQPPSGISIPLHLILQNRFVVAFSPTATEKQWLWPVLLRWSSLPALGVRWLRQQYIWGT